jgi:hypothetical protein
MLHGRRFRASRGFVEVQVQPSGAVIFLLVFGQRVAMRRRRSLETVLAVFGEIRGGGPIWDVESGGTACVLVSDCQRPQSRACLKPEVTSEEFSLAHDFFDYRGLETAIARCGR